MKLFFKHLFRTILYRPLQPLILILTLSVSLAISLVALGTEGAIDTEIASHQAAAYGKADLSITQNGDSLSRFMFAEDAEELLDGSVAAGVYDLPIYHPVREETLFCAAVDFRKIGNVFSLSFSEYDAPSESEVGDAIFISRALADRMELCLGDTLDVGVLGYDKTYKVCGITKTPPLSSYDCLADISGVVELLARDSVLVSALGEEFRPASTVYIDLPSELPVGRAIEMLSTSPMFAGKTFTDVAERAAREANSDILSSIVDIAVLCSSLLSVAIGFACLYILSRARAEENAAFAMAGARRLYLHLFEYGEMLFYLLAASFIGTPLSLLILKLLIQSSDFKYAVAALSFTDVLFAVSVLVLTGLVTVALFHAADRAKAHKRVGRLHISTKHALIALLALLAALSLLLLIAPMVWRLPLAVGVVLALLALLSLFLPFCFSAVAVLSDRVRNTPLALAMKNVGQVKVLHNACRLVALTTSLLIILGTSIISANGYLATAKTMIRTDFAVLGATERTKTAIKETGICGVSSLYMSTVGQSDGNYVYAMSLEDVDMLSDAMGISELPKGDGVIISKGQAISLGLSVGDPFTVTIDGEKYTLTVSGITRSGIAFVIFDSKHFALPYNMLLVKGDEALSRAALREKLVSSLALEVGTVVGFEDVMHERVGTLQNYVTCANLLLTVVLIFTLLGLADNLYESYRRRAGEFSLFAYGGMSRSLCRKMKCYELLLTFGLGILAGSLIAIPSFLAVRAGLFGRGYDLWINLLRAL